MNGSDHVFCDFYGTALQSAQAEPPPMEAPMLQS